MPNVKPTATYMDIINKEIDNRKKELFVQHHQAKYGGDFPIWVIVELFSFGMLSHFYADLPVADKKYLARTFYNAHYNAISSWLRCCTDLRNFCAHFQRLYYRVFTAIPNGLPELDTTNNRSLFGAIMPLKNLSTDAVRWNEEVFDPVKALVAEYNSYIQLNHIGFPVDWEIKLKR